MVYIPLWDYKGSEKGGGGGQRKREREKIDYSKTKFRLCHLRGVRDWGMTKYPGHEAAAECTLT